MNKKKYIAMAVVLLSLLMQANPTVSLGLMCQGPPLVNYFDRFPDDPIFVGDTVSIGVEIENPDEVGQEVGIYTYASYLMCTFLNVEWTFSAKPFGSNAVLVDGGSEGTFIAKDFTPDLPGLYRVQITATNDAGSITLTETVNVQSDCNEIAQVSIDTVSPGAAVSVADTVVLTGSATNPHPACAVLTLSWQLTSKPATSTATMTSASGTTSSFSPDVPGSYQVLFSARNDIGVATATQTITASGGQNAGDFEVNDDEGDNGTNASALSISSLNPTSGVPGSLVVISGTNFSNVFSENLVFFGNVQAQVVAATATSLTVVVPELPDGFYAVTVTVVSANRLVEASVESLRIAVAPDVEANGELSAHLFQNDGSNIILFEVNQAASVRPFTPQDVQAGFVVGEFLIFFVPGISILQIEALQAEFMFESMVAYPDLGYYRARLPNSTPALTLEVLDALNLDPRVDAAFLNRLVDILQVADPQVDSQGWLLSLGLPQGFDTFFPNRGAGTTIAIIDTGADLDLPSDELSELNFPPSAPEGLNFSPVRDVPNAEDELGHGTVVSTIAAASANNFNGLGVAPNAVVLALKVFTVTDGQVVASNEGVSEALLQAFELEVDVVNMSLGCEGCSAQDEQLLRDFYKRVVDNLIANQNKLGKKLPIIVAASGNDGEALLDSPAALDTVIAVGSIAPDLSGRSPFSNYGPELDFMAVGEEPATTVLGGGFSNAGSGTSFAAPQVSGLVALILSERPGLELEAVIELIKSCFTADVGVLGFDEQTGWGRVVVPSAIPADCAW